MPNLTWQPEHQEFQEFQAWKLEMNKNLVQGIQPQAQAPSFIAEPSNNVDASGEVVNNPHSTVQHQLVLNKVDIRTRISHLVFLSVQGLQQQFPANPSLPQGTTHEGLVQLQNQLRLILLRLRTDQFKLKI